MKNKIGKFLVSTASVIGRVVVTVVQAAKDALDVVLQTIIPFLIFVTTIFTLITQTGFGNVIANGLSGLAKSPIGLLALGIIITFPILSPIVGPGAVIPQIIGTLIGGLIATGDIPLSMALPALYAIHQPSGADFIPVGMSLTEAEPETVEIGVPAVLFAKFIIAPVEIIAAIIIGQLLFK